MLLKMDALETDSWDGFVGGKWQKEVEVRDFIQRNYTPYEGDDSFLAGPTQDTKDLWQMVLDLSKKEREAGGVLDMDTKVVSTLTSHQAGYLDKSKEKIVGFQTDKPFKRGMNVYGGIRMAMKACEDNGYKVDPEIVEFFTTHRKTHNAGVFDVYDDEIRRCRTNHIITGLPDAYGRGRIIGDYRRVALYGIDFLIEDKKIQKESFGTVYTDDVIRGKEEIAEQIRALQELKKMASFYGINASDNEISISTSKKLNSTWPVNGDFDNPYHGLSRDDCKKAIIKYLTNLKKFASTSNKANQNDAEKIANVIKLLKKAK